MAKNKINGYLLTWFVSAILAAGICYGTITANDYIPRSEMEQIVLRLDTEITRLHEEINRLYELK